jgi:hypothetical protein
MGPKVAYGNYLTAYAADAANTGDIYFHSNGNVYSINGVGSWVTMGAWELDTSTVAGLQADIDSKLSASSYTAADVLAKIKTVDGPGSGLDADLLDGYSRVYYRNATNLNAGTVDIARMPVATQAEAEAGSSTSKVMTPQRVKQAIDSLTTPGMGAPAYTSTVTSSWFTTKLTFTHGLGRMPRLVRLYLEVKTAGQGYAVGDRIPLSYDAYQQANGAKWDYNSSTISAYVFTAALPTKSATTYATTWFWLAANTSLFNLVLEVW